MTRSSPIIFTVYLFICFALAKNKNRNDIKCPLYGHNQKVDSHLASDRIVSEYVFQQKVDHFDSTSTKTWCQRYFMTDKFFIENDGPVFLNIGGEKPISILKMSKGMWLAFAHKYKALCFYVEHRYYGESLPTEDMSADNLQYLTIGQALSDLANFITTMKEERKLTNNKWILFGGSYAGALAAWMRSEHSGLVDGAIASSACFPKNVYHPEFYESVNDILKKYNKKCTAKIEKALGAVRKMMKKDCQSVTKQFNLNPPLDCSDRLQVSFFFKVVTSLFSYNVIKKKVPYVCDAMTEKSRGETIDRLAFLFGQKHNVLSHLNIAQQTLWDRSNYPYERQWDYQRCTEYGGLHTFSKKQPFGKNIDSKLVLRMFCTETFGEEYNEKKIAEGIANIIEKYGGLDTHFSRTVFTVGTLDPWSDVQMSEKNEAGNLVVKINGASHCEDMNEPQSHDSKSMIDARNKIDESIVEWIQM